MRRSVIAFLLFVTIGVASAHASCGSSSCPLDLNSLLAASTGFTLDVSFQYIDQDQPRIGTRSAGVGEIAGAHHDEVRTINRISTALLTYRPTSRATLSLGLPFVSRSHQHLGSSHAHNGITSDHNVIPQSWDINGLGDVVLEGRYALARHNPIKQSGLWLIAGAKLPTGDHDRHNGEGEPGELPIQPGSGTTDGLVGLSYQGTMTARTLMSGPLGRFASLPWFATAGYTFRTGDTDGYRFGNELQVNTGIAYPITHRLEILGQVNSRFRTRDRINGDENEERFTGGTFVYVTPGLRLSHGGVAVYAMVQLPVYQNVNALQLTSRSNLIAGVQTRF